MSEPLISVILPVYNVALYIEKCLLSVINQVYKNIEIILVDDCSPDNSIEIAVECLSSNNFTNYHVATHQVNGGAAVARNTGLSLAKGDFLYFMDNDDYAEHSLLSEMMIPFSDADVDIVVCNFWKVTVNEGKKEVGFESPFTGKVDSIIALQALLEDKEHSYVWRNLYKRKVFENVRFAEKVVFEDVMTTPLVWANAKNIYFIPQLLYNYVQRPGSVTTNWKKIEWFYHIVDFMKRNEQHFKTHSQLSVLYKKMLMLHYGMLRNFSLQLAQGPEGFKSYKRQFDRYRSHVKTSFLLRFPLPDNLQLVYQLLILKISVGLFWKKYRVKLK